MYLVTNPAPSFPTQPPPILVSNLNGGLQLIPQATPPPLIISHPQTIQPLYQATNFNPLLPHQTPLMQINSSYSQSPSLVIPNTCSANVKHAITSKQEQYRHQVEQPPKSITSQQAKSVAKVSYSDSNTQSQRVNQVDGRECGISDTVKHGENATQGDSKQKITFVKNIKSRSKA